MALKYLTRVLQSKLSQPELTNPFQQTRQTYNTIDWQTLLAWLWRWFLLVETSVTNTCSLQNYTQTITLDKHEKETISYSLFPSLLRLKIRSKNTWGPCLSILSLTQYAQLQVSVAWVWRYWHWGSLNRCGRYHRIGFQPKSNYSKNLYNYNFIQTKRARKPSNIHLPFWLCER